MTPTSTYIFTGSVLAAWALVVTLIKVFTTDEKPAAPKTAFPTTTEVEVALPTDADGLDTFIQNMVDDYCLPDTTETAFMISTMILHLPPHKAYAKRSYFAESVLKQMANEAAFPKHQALKKVIEAKEKAEAEKKSNLTLVTEPTVASEQPIQNA